MREDDEKVIKALTIYILLIALAVIAPIAAYFKFLIPAAENPEVWFQRSGSISVLFAVWAEYELSKIGNLINLSGIASKDQVDLKNKYSIVSNLAKYLGVLVAIFGTLIWGYGDLIFNM